MADDMPQGVGRDLDCDVCCPDAHTDCIKTTKSWSGSPEPTPSHRRCARHRGLPVPYRQET